MSHTKTNPARLCIAIDAVSHEAIRSCADRDLASPHSMKALSFGDLGLPQPYEPVTQRETHLWWELLEQAGSVAAPKRQARRGASSAPAAVLQPCDEASTALQVAATLWAGMQRVLGSDRAAPRGTAGRPGDSPSHDAPAFLDRTPQPYPPDAPKLRLSTLVMKREEIGVTELVHAMALGETGSGKTRSFLMPLLQAALAYRCDGLRSAALIVDPKSELLPFAKACLAKEGRSDDLVVIGQPGGTAPPRWFDSSLPALTMGDRVDKLRELIPELQYTLSEGDSWKAKSMQLVTDFLTLEEAWHQATSRSLLLMLHQLLPTLCEPRTRWMALDALLQWASRGRAELAVASAALTLARKAAGVEAHTPHPLKRFLAMGPQEAMNQLFYEVRLARAMTGLLANPMVTDAIDVDPIAPVKDGAETGLRHWIDAGKIIIYQPRQSRTQNFVARALKSAFFTACFHRQELARPVFYVADEFQRFITLEGDSADHDFLDRCRAYRVSCLLATQSLSALVSATNCEKKVDCLLQNIPTLTVFRTRDERAQRLLKDALQPPALPFGPRKIQHVLDVRPTALLETGAYYFSAPIGAGHARGWQPKD